MSESSTVVGFVERWQTGAFLLVASALAGFLAGALGGEVGAPFALAGFAVGSVTTFLVLSYALYGR
jgi:hypothetical protein